MSMPRLSILASVYQGLAYLPAYLDELQSQTLFAQCEVIFVCNAPSAEELEILRTFQQAWPAQVQILEVPRETLSASWNRAWQLARAPLLAIWNIDDRRTPDSLQRQVEAMERAPWALCYGDYLAVAQYGDEAGVVRHTPAYSAAHFARAFAQGGAFWVLRRAVAEQIGYFDEQFRIAPDMEYSLRIAVNRLPMGRVDGVLGYFTAAGLGLSTRAGELPARERTAVQLRYGVFDKVQAEPRAAAASFRLDHVQSFGQWQPLAALWPQQHAYLRRRQPLWLLGRLRFALRRLLARLGLLEWLHARLHKEL
ncbi:MAG: glycosyltransferase [Anaerolineales bacterium]|nr:glycosyltransferase [Anaerolineales bacterium]